MYIIKTDNGTEINVLSIYSSVGVDLQELLMDADTAARHEFAIVNGRMMPHAIQTSICKGELYDVMLVGAPSLIQIDVIVFGDESSELLYLALNKNDKPFFINRNKLQNGKTNRT